MEQLWGLTLGSSFGKQEQLGGTTLRNRSFEKPQFWGIALEHNFGGQLSEAALKNSFGEPLWGTGLKRSRFGAMVLQRYFGE